MSTRTLSRTAVAVVAAAAVSGCAQLAAIGTVADVLGGALGGPGQQQQRLLVEVQQVDTRQQAIHVRTQDGRTGAVRYDRNTQVVYRQQQYPVTALERGDVATLEVRQLQNQELYAERVLVEQSVQERTGAATQGVGYLEQISGRVGEVNPQTGMFELETARGVVTVSVPANASGAVLQRFRQLRRGDAVAVEGSVVAANLLELRRFL